MSEYIWGIFIVIVVIGASIAGASAILKIAEESKECDVNKDCGSEFYCGSDFKCHEFPNIDKTIVQKDLTTPAAIIGLSLVVMALILRRKR